MKLVIFDVDGTLTDTNEVDGACFRLAFQQEFGLRKISCDWESYNYTTDQGIATEVLTSFLNRNPLDSELSRARTRFIQNLRDAYCLNPQDFQEVRGAGSILRLLREETDWKVAIATGCWAESARFKLQRAGLQTDTPFASCEDSTSRDGIVSRVIEKAKFYYECKDFTTVVFVGDGVWDVTTAKNLGIGFVGISANEKRQRLRKAGAKFICTDYQLTPVFLDYLNHFDAYESSN
jgi:phosphoglycolate phosphatase-like HAD superfamily hydrolase